MIRDGRFREDLLFRINTVEIRLPPLRERREEILELANAQLGRKAAQYARAVRGFDPLALSALQNYAWPGNVRELNSVVERSLLLAAGDEIGAADLRLSAAKSGPPSLEEMSLEDAERALIRSAIRRNGGSVQAAAEALGLSRSAMYRRLEKLGLEARRALAAGAGFPAQQRLHRSPRPQRIVLHDDVRRQQHGIGRARGPLETNRGQRARGRCC